MDIHIGVDSLDSYRGDKNLKASVNNKNDSGSIYGKTITAKDSSKTNTSVRELKYINMQSNGSYPAMDSSPFTIEKRGSRKSTPRAYGASEMSLK